MARMLSNSLVGLCLIFVVTAEDVCEDNSPSCTTNSANAAEPSSATLDRTDSPSASDEIDLKKGNSNDWARLMLNDSETESINWHDYLSFHWSTPVLHASEDPVMSPFLQDSIFKLIANNTFLSTIFDKHDKPSHFGNIYNLTQLVTELPHEMDENSRRALSQFLDVYKERIPQWMTLWTRNQALIRLRESNIFLVKLEPGDTIPLHGSSSFPITKFDGTSINVADYAHNHDLVSVMALQPLASGMHDGIHIYDPRGGVSGYGFGAHELITTSQHQHLNMRGGSVCVLPSKLSFIMTPVTKHTRYFVISFADLATKMRHYTPQDPTTPKADDNDLANSVSTETFDIPSIYDANNDRPYWEQNIGLFSSFGTPIFRTSMLSNASSKESIVRSVSVPRVQILRENLSMLNSCILYLSEEVDTIHKSNRGSRAWQSRPYLFGSKFDSKAFGPENSSNLNKAECVASLELLESYIYEQLSLWVLSFRNSYYFDDNGIFIQIHTGNVIGIKITHSWANVNYDDGFNMPHLHTGSDLSGVVYLSVPECHADAEAAGEAGAAANGVLCDGNEASLFFNDPRSKLFDNNMRFSFGEFNEPLKVKPTDGDVVLFPAWLHHWTMPSYNGTHPRVSIAFNVDFVGYEMKDIVGEEDILFVRKK